MGCLGLVHTVDKRQPGGIVYQADQYPRPPSRSLHRLG